MEGYYDILEVGKNCLAWMDSSKWNQFLEKLQPFAKFFPALGKAHFSLMPVDSVARHPEHDDL